MDEKEVNWRFEGLEKTAENHEKILEDHEKRIRNSEKFETSTVQQLINIFKNIDEQKENDKWIKRAFGNALIISIIGGVITFVFWAIEKVIGG